MSSKLIVADENIPGVRELFAPLGKVVTLPGRALRAADVAAADLLLVRSVTRVDKALLAGSRVRWVGTATIGTDHLETAWLADAGIAWANAPGSNADSVVDYVLSALAVAGDLLERLLAGNARAAVVGVGNVGGRLLARLQALGIAAIGCDPPRAAADPHAARGLPLRSLAEALACDVVLLHTPLVHEGRWPTYHLIDAAALAQLPPGALLLNGGRGAVLDNRALGAALADRQLTAVLDVWEGEPAIDLALLDQVLLGTPHIAGYSLDGKLNGARQLLRACCAFVGVPVPALHAPAAAAPQLRLNPAATDAELLRQAILGVYDVREDDRRLRQAAATAAATGEGISAGFDRLRRDYPVRRELSAAQVENWSALSAHQQRLLTAAGVSTYPAE